MGREVSESCIDSLLTVMVSTYCNRFYANKPELAARRIEAIGYQALIICEVQMLQVVITKFSRCQGTFVLQDNRFRWLTRMSIDQSPENGTSEELSIMADNKMMQSMHLYFPCGIIRGALSNLGIPCAVSADISNLPACEFICDPNKGLTRMLRGFEHALIASLKHDNKKLAGEVIEPIQDDQKLWYM
ncbi:hypothetical protein GOBAR_DD33879 [Gossypium barbadense]|nr:hypothetical protein GOBAR_DD33879 [Gossypium barbadense]